LIIEILRFSQILIGRVVRLVAGAMGGIGGLIIGLFVGLIVISITLDAVYWIWA
jgi:tetrahydromethanopterin S-methyltransferase subunit F